MLTLFVAANIALAPLPPPARDVPILLKDVHRIVTLGDSITQGGGGRGGYVWLIDHKLNELYPNQKIEVINAGISGHKATDMSARFKRDVLDKKPDLVTISVGVNDVWHAHRDFAKGIDYPNGDTGNGVPLPEYRRLLTEMVKSAQSAGVKVVLVAPTLIYENIKGVENRRLMDYVAAQRAISRELNCKFVDLNMAFRDVVLAYRDHAGEGLNLLTSDGVHMNEAGNRLMAYEILKGFGISTLLLQQWPK